MLSNLQQRILILIGIIIILFCYKECSGDKVKPEVVTKVVTLTKTHWDTIVFPRDSIVIRKLTIIDSIPSKEDSTITKYTTVVSDSLIEGKIITDIKNNGTLINQDFTYIPKFPKYIIRTDSVLTTITNDIKSPYWGVYAGGSIMVSQNATDIIPTLGFKTKKDYYFHIGYGVINKSIIIGTQFNIIKSK